MVWEHGFDIALVIMGSGLASLLVLIAGLGVGIKAGYISPTVLLSSIHHLDCGGLLLANTVHQPDDSCAPFVFQIKSRV